MEDVKGKESNGASVGNGDKPINPLKLFPAEVWEAIIKELWRDSPSEAIKIAGTCTLFLAFVVNEMQEYSSRINAKITDWMTQQENFRRKITDQKRQIDGWNLQAEEMRQQAQVLIWENDEGRLNDLSELLAAQRIEWEHQIQGWKELRDEYETRLTQFQVHVAQFKKLIREFTCMIENLKKNESRCSIFLSSLKDS